MASADDTRLNAAFSSQRRGTNKWMSENRKWTMRWLSTVRWKNTIILPLLCFYTTYIRSGSLTYYITLLQCERATNPSLITLLCCYDRKVQRILRLLRYYTVMVWTCNKSFAYYDITLLRYERVTNPSLITLLRYMYEHAVNLLLITFALYVITLLLWTCTESVTLFPTNNSAVRLRTSNKSLHKVFF